MSHASSRVKDQSAIARRKVERKREQRRAGVPVVIAKNRGEHVGPAEVISKPKVVKVICGKIHPFVPGLLVHHKTQTAKFGKLVRRVESGPDAGKWFVRWDRAKTNSGPYVERNLSVV